MPFDREERIEELFHDCLERKASERAAFLERACGHDTELRRDVEELLASHGRAFDFPEKPAWSAFVKPAPPHAAPSERPEPEPGIPFEKLGEYRLIRRLGEGGMGVVYLAIQESLQRRVALKVIRSDRLASREVEERFRREADAISKLRHANIVTVFGSGEEKGALFFAMELVEGIGLDEMLHRSLASAEKPTILQVVDWMRDIARALHCAHEAGIIHRDVKPSNIRLTPEGRAMLLDFGVAQHADLSSLTLTGQFRGTPHYASPEQIKARRREIDSRTDVYSLGATFYQAVTGRVPFEGETTEQVFRKILDDDPLPPHRLNPSIAQDLETVIITAMDKNPDRRYQSCAELADDLDRFRCGEMIRAKPAGLVTKAWKRVRRHPVWSTAAGVSLCSAVGLVLYVMLWSYPRIIEERDKAELQRRIAQRAQMVAEQEAAKATAINEFLEEMLASVDPELGDKDATVVDVLDGAVKKIDDSFSGQPEIKATIHNTIGNTYRSLGRYGEAEQQHREAVEILTTLHGRHERATLDSINMLAHTILRQGRYREAESLYCKILETNRQVAGKEDPATITYMSNLALTLGEQGSYAEAESLQREALDLSIRVLGDEHVQSVKLMNNLAISLAQQNATTEAETILRRILEIQERIRDETDHSTLQALSNLALLLINRGEHEEAESILLRTIEIYRGDFGDDHPETLKNQSSLVRVYQRQKRFDEAEELAREVFERQDRTLGKRNPDTLLTLFCLSKTLLALGRPSEAEALQREVLLIGRDVLGADHPNIIETIQGLSLTLLKQGKHEEAASLILEGLESAERIQSRPSWCIGQFRANLGQCLVKLERYDEAEEQILASYHEFAALLGKEHPVAQKMLKGLIDLLEALDKPSEAARYCEMLSRPETAGEEE